MISWLNCVYLWFDEFFSLLVTWWLVIQWVVFICDLIGLWLKAFSCDLMTCFCLSFYVFVCDLMTCFYLWFGDLIVLCHLIWWLVIQQVFICVLITCFCLLFDNVFVCGLMTYFYLWFDDLIVLVIWFDGLWFNKLFLLVIWWLLFSCHLICFCLWSDDLFLPAIWWPNCVYPWFDDLFLLVIWYVFVCDLMTCF